MNRAPEPSETDIARARLANAALVFTESDGRLTVAYYRRLQEKGAMGIIAMNLFRAQKTSERAKQYRGRGYKQASYDVKNYSLSQLCASLGNHLPWGWKRDPNTTAYEWVLYVDLPTGQVSFHSATRGDGPDYPGEWSGEHTSRENVLAFCDSILTEAA